MNIEKMKSSCCKALVKFVSGYPQCSECGQSCKVEGDYMDKTAPTPTTPREDLPKLYAGQVQMLKEAGISIEDWQKCMVSVEEFCALMNIRKPENARLQERETLKEQIGKLETLTHSTDRDFPHAATWVRKSDVEALLSTERQR